MLYLQSMNPALEQLSKEELIALLQEKDCTIEKQDAALAQKQKKVDHLQRQEEVLQDKVELLQWQVEQLRRMAYGQKRERFEADANQLPLPFEATPEKEQQQEEELVEKIEYVRKKQSSSSHKGRVALPEHLPVEEVVVRRAK